MGKAVGIDLGNHPRAVGIYQNGKVEIIANDQGNRPNAIVCRVQRRTAYRRPRKVPWRLMNLQTPSLTLSDSGRRMGEESVKNDVKHFPFEVVSGEGNKPVINVE